MALDQFQKLRTEDHISLKRYSYCSSCLETTIGTIERGTRDKTKIYVYYESHYFRYIMCLSHIVS